MNENTFTGEERRELYERQGGKCAYCGNDFPIYQLENDHIVPIFKGGVNTKANIALACRSCNARKGVKPVEVFIGVSEGIIK